MENTSFNGLGSSIASLRVVTKTALIFDIVSIVGFFLIGLSVYQGVQAYDILTNGIVTSATVTDLVKHTSHNSKGHTSTSYTTTFKYEVNGEKYEQSDDGRHSIGSAISILYLPKHPEVARINNRLSIVGLPIGLAVSGILLAGIFKFVARKLRGRAKVVVELIAHGHPVDGTVAGFQILSKGSKVGLNNQRRTCRLSVKLRKPGKEQDELVNSDAIILNNDQINNALGKNIKVFFDYEDSNTFYVDTRELEGR